MIKKRFRILLLGVVICSSIMFSCSKDDDPIKADPKPNPEIVSIIQNISSDSIQKYVKTLEDMGTRFAFAANRRDVAVSIKTKFESFGYTDVALDSFQLSMTYLGTYYDTWQYNVVATLSGSVFPDSISIIGGHHDCIVRSTSGNPLNISPGANDNASGVATTLEVARVLKKTAYSPKNTIKFITFAAEELGLYGSWDYARKADTRNDKIKMMLNNDMVAYWSSPDTSNWCVNILDYANSVPLRMNAQEVCKTYTSLKTKNDNTYSAYSDSYPFSRLGFNAIFFITNANDINYHTIYDLSTACNFKFCREVAKVNCVLLIQDDFTN